MIKTPFFRRRLDFATCAFAWLAAATLGTAAPTTGDWVYAGHQYAQVPTSITTSAGVAQIRIGGGHTMILKQDGSITVSGANSYGQCDVPAEARTGIVAIAAGGSHSVVLKQNGKVIAWGYNGYGQTTVPLAAESGVIAIAAGQKHSVALKQDGSVVTWGDNAEGQTRVPGEALAGVDKIIAGPYARSTFYRLGTPPPPDQDGDGLGDAAETQLAALGFNPSVSQPALVSALFSAANSAGLYTAAQIQALHPGKPLISHNPATGKIKLTLDWRKSTDLLSFTDFPATPAEVSVNQLGDIEFEFTAPALTAFFRLDVN